MKDADARELLVDIMGNEHFTGERHPSSLGTAVLHSPRWPDPRSARFAADAQYQAVQAQLNDQLGFASMKLKTVKFPVGRCQFKQITACACMPCWEDFTCGSDPCPCWDLGTSLGPVQSCSERVPELHALWC
jgi:hypothetical protein